MKLWLVAAVFLGLLISAGMASAESPILVTHTLTGYSMGSDSVVLSYILKVKNPGYSNVSNLTLAQVPLFMIGTDRITLSIESLEPLGETQIPFSIVTPMLLDQAAFSERPLFWAGEYTDGNGDLLEFPASSVEGGAL
ncbi:MAG: hypothetical protein NDI77_03590 [Geobacteraceae bacterium]|nr:hypothetical protein [Geobacteraceae bacterium]